MSAIFQNKFVNGVAALTVVLLVLGPVPNASAQDADPRITGSCTPRTQDQGPWDCKITKFIKNDCLGVKSISYDEVWKLVRNEDEASILLKSMYVDMSGPRNFYQWLACQDFHYVQIFSHSVEHPGMLVGDESIHISIYYDPKNSPFPTPFLAYYMAYGANFEIGIDNFGQMKTIKLGYTYE